MSEVPFHVFFIRHGESEQNLAGRQRKEGIDLLMEHLSGRHESHARLTPDGREQAAELGEWLRPRLRPSSDPRRPQKFFVSPYVRVMETAALLNIEHAKWTRHRLLGERNWGKLATALSGHFKEGGVYAAWKQESDREGAFWVPAGGESLMMATARVEHAWQQICASAPNGTVVVVAHGEIIQLFQMIIEGISPLDLKEVPHLANCGVLEYRSRNPYDGNYENELCWRRVMSMVHPERSQDWERFEQPQFTNQELLEIVEEHPAHFGKIHRS